jgi:hypothetical protein
MSKRPIAWKRATSVGKPIPRERALLQEEPMWTERAIRPE